MKEKFCKHCNKIFLLTKNSSKKQFCSNSCSALFNNKNYSEIKKNEISEKNIYTEKIPIELEHIDGNSENNDLKNLTLLCPNCHSLTSTYKGANLGNGRSWRKKHYIKNKDI